MGGQDVPLEELWKKAAGKGYKLAGHRAEDSQRKCTTYVALDKTLKD